RLEIKKGIPISAGMGGSAASAVGAVVGASALLNQPLDRWDILRFALHGEELTSGSSPHSDNIAPCLFGGIQLSYRDQWIGTVPFPQEVLCVLVHPNIKIETKMARDILEKSVPLGKHVSQMARLAGFLLGCTSGERGLIQNNLRDEIIEPQRQKLIPGFRSIQNAAFCLGAWGCSISGSGPSVFALVDDKVKAEEIRLEIITQFEIEGIEAESWISPISKEGARVLL
ncbi:MAG: homoserine kinase, partial [Bdellovibrionales bacterium]|nr:homoserine kinase [Bdellovibrionales bacterium]